MSMAMAMVQVERSFMMMFGRSFFPRLELGSSRLWSEAVWEKNASSFCP